MKLLVTGATGFLGRYVVGEALRQGHEVRAVVRPASSVERLDWIDRVECAAVDLRNSPGLADAVRGVDAVVHLAAAKSGDIYAQLAGTVVATENLLRAMTEAGVRRIVLISSFAVYDYRRLRSRSLLDESAPLEARPRERDEYCQTKLMQETMVRKHAQRQGWKWTVLRPGVIYGPGETWTARLGLRLSDNRWVRTGAWAPVPLTYVENCAEAIVACAAHDAANGRVFNVVDDRTPRQRAYMNALRGRVEPRPRVVPISWTMMRCLAGAAWLTNRWVFKGRAKVPQILNPASLHARCKPLRYTNAALRQAVGWSPRYSLDEALDRCFQRFGLDAEPVDQVAAQPAVAPHPIPLPMGEGVRA